MTVKVFFMHCHIPWDWPFLKPCCLSVLHFLFLPMAAIPILKICCPFWAKVTAAINAQSKFNSCSSLFVCLFLPVKLVRLLIPCLRGAGDYPDQESRFTSAAHKMAHEHQRSYNQYNHLQLGFSFHDLIWPFPCNLDSDILIYHFSSSMRSFV